MVANRHPNNSGTKTGEKTLIGVWVDDGLVLAIDSAASRITFCDRSKYIRQALEEKLSRDVIKAASEEDENIRIARKIKRVKSGK